MDQSQTERYPFKRSWRWGIVQLLDFIFDFFAKHRKKLPFPKNVRNILVVRLDHIGDLISALPVFPILRERFPEASITALVGQAGEAILKSNPFVDHVIVFYSNWFSRKKRWSLREYVSVLRALKKARYDLGFDLRGDIRNILLMTFAGVRYRVGYGIGGGAGLLHEIRPYDFKLHQVELNARFVSEQDVDKAELKPEIHLTSSEIEAALQILRRFGVPENSKLIVVHPEAGYPSKEWSEEKFKDLVNELLQNPRIVILIIGVSEKARNFSRHFSGSQRVVNLVGALSVRQLIAALHHCRLLIGNDSGPSHIAQAIGLPVVVIASGTNEYEKWGVWVKRARVLKHAVPCSPCHLKYCNVEGHPCMSQISTEAVMSAVREFIPGGVR